MGPFCARCAAVISVANKGFELNFAVKFLRTLALEPAMTDTFIRKGGSFVVGARMKFSVAGRTVTSGLIKFVCVV